MTDTQARLTAALADRYRVERELGQGGMATVYLAHDLKHDRNVAIKVLHPDLAAALGGERFLSEIKTTAKLQHPHILPLLDSGGADGLLFYVMPYVTGETLRARLEREQQLPVEDALRIAREVADALGSAHALGIVHRDIKPENILLQGGHALVADFGIALAVQQAGGQRMTQTGLSLGTPQYMSPEQAMGEKVIDARSDIYALGAVTYEMLVGDPPFTGSSIQAIVGRILTEIPRPLSAQRHTIASNVEAAVLRALEKLPADRFASASDFIAALGSDAVGATFARPVVHARTAAPGRERLLGGALVAALAIAAWGWLRQTPEPLPSRQQVVLWTHALESSLGSGTALIATQAAIAPDGSSIVFTDSTSAGFILKRKMRGEVDAAVLAGSEGGVSPFFSPDGQWIGFLTVDGKVRKMPVTGGGAFTLAEQVNVEYKIGAWMDDGTIVYTGIGSDIRGVSADGGPSRVIVDARGGSWTAIILTALPGSRGLLMTLCPGNCAIESKAVLFDFAADSLRTLVPGVAGAWYSSTGHLLYVDREGGLFAMGFDATRLTTTTGALPLVSGVTAAGFAVSANGDVLYSSDASGRGDSELLWVDRTGRTEPFDPGWSGRFEYPALAPDGRTLAVSVREGTTDLWLRRPDGSRQKVLAEGGANWRPSWMPDGKSLVFVSAGRPLVGTNGNAIMRVQTDLSRPAEVLHRGQFEAWEGELSRDGTFLVVRNDDGDSDSDIYYRRVDEDTTLKPLLLEPSQSTTVALSPDGRWLAYASDEGSSRYEVYVASFPEMTSRRLVSRGGGTEARWSRDGREIFFESGGKLMAADVLPGPTFQTGNPRALFSLAGYRRARNRQQYDVAPDGRFVMIRQGERSIGQLVYGENWLSGMLVKVR